MIVFLLSVIRFKMPRHPFFEEWAKGDESARFTRPYKLNVWKNNNQRTENQKYSECWTLPQLIIL